MLWGKKQQATPAPNPRGREALQAEIEAWLARSGNDQGDQGEFSGWGAFSLHWLQSSHWAEHRRYWQGLWTHSDSLIPSDGRSVPADRAHHAPHHQQGRSWKALGVIPKAGLPFRLRCDVYRLPSGSQGYTVTVQFRWDGCMWQRTVNRGCPEEDGERAEEWHVVSEG